MAQENTETHTVMYGRSPGEYMHVAAGISKKLPNKLFGFLHEVKLIGLEPNTTYYYVCGDEFGGFSEEHSFTTASEVGQDHTYERSFPIYAEQVVDSHPNEYDNPAGTIYVVTGGGGKSLYEIGSDYWTAYTESIYQHVKVDILQEDKAFHLQAISSDGDRIDEFWIYK
jgi:hypothetical protein